MDDGVTTLLKNEIAGILSALSETIDEEEVFLFEKVAVGRINKIGSYSRPVAEVMSDTEDNFLYTFHNHHKSRDIIIMVSIFVKGLTEVAEKKKDNLKDIVIAELEDNPNFNEKSITSQILTVNNGVRAEGLGKGAKLFAGAQILIKCKLSNPLS